MFVDSFIPRSLNQSYYSSQISVYSNLCHTLSCVETQYFALILTSCIDHPLYQFPKPVDMPSKRAAKASKATESTKRAKVTASFDKVDDTAHELVSSRQVPLLLETNSLSLPVPFGAPPVWAVKKQQLCETLHAWFNHYQAGVYCKDKIAYGMLVDGGFARRDKLNEELLITRAGGCRIKGKNGEYDQGKDQRSGDSVVQALINSMEAGIPIGVIAGK